MTPIGIYSSTKGSSGYWVRHQVVEIDVVIKQGRNFQGNRIYKLMEDLRVFLKTQGKYFDFLTPFPIFTIDPEKMTLWLYGQNKTTYTINIVP